MPRVLNYAALMLSVVLIGTACSNDRERRQTGVQGSSPVAGKAQIEVTGCLTTNRDTGQFVLTANSNALTSAANRAAAGEAETFTYQLIGGSNLPDYVGREVVITGALEGHGQDVDIESKTKSEEPPTQRRGETVTPAIETKEEIEIQVERLHVASINPTGAQCRWR